MRDAERWPSRRELELPWGRVEERTSLGVGAVVLLVVFYATLMVVGLGRERALTRHEVFAAQPAREMLDASSGVPTARRWMVQQFAGEPRYQKPPAMSWMIAGSFAVFGEREWAARLPAVVAGGTMVVMVGMWGARLFGYTVGVVSGLMQATFYYTLMQARLAEVDMPLGAIVTAGMLCVGYAWVGGVVGRRRALLGWAFAVLAGVAMAMKGPVGPGVMYVGAVAFAGVMRSREVLWWVAHPGRVAVFVAVAALWPVGAYLADPEILPFWVKELSGRAATGIQGAEPWWFYLWNAPMLLLPWVLVAPVSVWELMRRGRREGQGPLLKFTGAWVVGGMLLLSLVADKHKHYAIPLLAGVTPLLAVGFVAAIRHQQRQPVRWYGRSTGAWLVAIGAGVAAALRWGGENGGVVAVVVGLLGAGGVVVLQMERLRWGRGQMIAVFATAWVTMAAVNGLVTPAVETFWRFRAVAMAARAHIGAGEKVTLVNLGMHPVAFYLPLPVGRVDAARAEDVPAGGSLVMVAQGDVEKLEELWGVWLDGLVAGGTTGRKSDDAIALCRVVRSLSPATGPDSMGGR